MSKHFEHRYYLSLLHSRPRFCTRTLHSAHSFHFKQQQDLSLLVPSVLARSTALTATTLNTDYCIDLLIASTTLNSSYCHCIDVLVIIALPRHIPSPGTLHGTGVIVTMLTIGITS